MSYFNNQNIKLEDRALKFWSENSLAEKSLNLYNYLTVIMSVVICLSFALLLFMPYVMGFSTYYPYSCTQIIFNNVARLEVFGEDKFNFLFAIGEFIVCVVFFVMNLIKIFKTIWYEKNIFKKEFYHKILLGIKNSGVKQKNTIGYFSLITSFWIWAFRLILIKKIFRVVEHFITLGVMNLIVVTLLLIRIKFYNVVKEEIYKFEFYSEGKYEMQKMS